MLASSVDIRIDGDALDAQLLGCAHDAAGDFTSVRNQDSIKHDPTARRRGRDGGQGTPRRVARGLKKQAAARQDRQDARHHFYCGNGLRVRVRWP